MASAHRVRLVNDNGEVHDHLLTPGDECPACERKLPLPKSDEPTGAAGTRFCVTVPPGEEGVLDLLLIAVVEKYQAAWPEDAAEMRAGIGLALVGGRRWKYRALHFALSALLQVPGLAPVEEGQ